LWRFDDKMSVIYWEIFCAETESVEFYDLCRKNIIYVTLTTELFIDKDVSKTDETFHEECHLKRKK
jgi:hypothetical protein